jgi:hypothetical protein
VASSQQQGGEPGKFKFKGNPDEADKNKLHNEIDQYINQQFTICMAAITLWGVFLAVTVSGLISGGASPPGARRQPDVTVGALKVTQQEPKIDLDRIEFMRGQMKVADGQLTITGEQPLLGSSGNSSVADMICSVTAVLILTLGAMHRYLKLHDSSLFVLASYLRVTGSSNWENDYQCFVKYHKDRQEEEKSWWARTVYPFRYFSTQREGHTRLFAVLGGLAWILVMIQLWPMMGAALFPHLSFWFMTVVFILYFAYLYIWNKKFDRKRDYDEAWVAIRNRDQPQTGAGTTAAGSAEPK